MSQKISFNALPLIEEALQTDEGHLKNYDDMESYNAAFLHGSIHTLTELKKKLIDQQAANDGLFQTIKTDIGDIRLFHSKDEHWEGVIIDVNGVQIARVEADMPEQLFQAMLWNGEEEDYVSKVTIKK